MAGGQGPGIGLKEFRRSGLCRIAIISLKAWAQVLSTRLSKWN